jgi:phage tail sheath gpL-like
LPETSREALGKERDMLVSLIGAGPAVDLTTRQGDASRELGVSLVQRDEAHEEAGVFATMSATSEGDRAPQPARSLHSGTAPPCTRGARRDRSGRAERGG